MKKQIYALALALTMIFTACAPAVTSSAPQSVAPQSKSEAPQSVSQAPAEKTTIKIASLKGPTTMGAVQLLADAEAGTSRHDYQIEIFGSAEEISPKLIKGEIDAAIIPSNLASVLYNKTEGEIVATAINNLGVLYMLSAHDGFKTIADLKGATIYTTGKGTTPEYILNYILRENGLDPDTDVTIEYMSEAAEAAQAFNLSSGYPVVMLPEPYVSSFLAQAGENVKTIFNMNTEWNSVSPDSEIVTGVLVARKGFLEENEAAFKALLQDYEKSIEFANTSPSEAAVLIEKYGIVPKAALAEKALPNCSLKYIDGAEMQSYISAYLSVLHAQNPQSVGGKLPDDDFYYKA